MFRAKCQSQFQLPYCDSIKMWKIGKREVATVFLSFTLIQNYIELDKESKHTFNDLLAVDELSID